MIKAKAEVSPKKLKPVLELLYGRRIWSVLVVNTIVLLVVVTATVIFGRLLLQSAYYSILRKDIPYLLLLTMLFIVILDLVVGCTKRIVTALTALLKIRKTDGDKVTGTQEYEFGEDGIFSRAKSDGFLCERFSVYSTVENVTEYKDNFIVHTRGNIGVFDFTDICEGDADKLRELLRVKLGERFRVRK